MDEHLLKRLIADLKSLSPAEFDFCVDCLTESQAWRLALLRLAEHCQPAADDAPAGDQSLKPHPATNYVTTLHQ